jgi:ADP-heptose:LPS heptosyltransferase
MSSIWGAAPICLRFGLCGRARLFIGIDCGVMHLAAAMGTPVVGIFGPSDWRLTARAACRIVSCASSNVLRVFVAVQMAGPA